MPIELKNKKLNPDYDNTHGLGLKRVYVEEEKRVVKIEAGEIYTPKVKKKESESNATK